MAFPKTPRSSLRLALLAGAVGALFAASAAHAQDDGRYNDASYTDDGEIVTVYAPHYHVERDVTGAISRVSLSRAVSYSDLDLTTPEGARELRHRVADTAHDICGQLADEVRNDPAGDRTCYRTARDDAMRRDDDDGE